MDKTSTRPSKSDLAVRLFHSVATLVLFLADLPGPAMADVRVVPAQANRIAYLEVHSSIRPGDAERFEELLLAYAASAKVYRAGDVPFIRVELDSPGGDVATALRIGSLVRGALGDVAVPDGKRCASSCVFILAAGAWRIVGEHARVGLHRPVFAGREFGTLSAGQGQERYNRMLAQLRSYLASMGMPDQLFVAMTRVPSDGIRWLTHDEAEDFGLEGEDPAIAEWDKAVARAQMGDELFKKFGSYLRCIEVPGSSAACRSLLD